MSDLDELDPDLKALLDRYGFDRERFEQWRRWVAEGKLSRESNVVRGRLEPPGSDTWIEMPRRDSAEGKEAIALGEQAIREGEVGVVILNGGMATRFGGVVKGIVEALPGRSFLALKVQNVLDVVRTVGGRVSVFVMNSFATDEATREHFAEHRNFGLAEGDLTFFTQGIALRLTRSGELFRDAHGRPSPYGPGHGDCPIFFRKSGCLRKFLAEGGRHLLISNVDNLAARLDPLALGMHLREGRELTAEVAPKWPGDKGGAPVLVDGKLWVVEDFRFPKDFDQDRIPVFNTNTFTVEAESLTKEIELTPLYVEKQVDGRPAVQIETLIGETTRLLDTTYLKVKRTGKESRFFPIKTPKDLEDGREDLEIICG